MRHAGLLGEEGLERWLVGRIAGWEGKGRGGGRAWAWEREVLREGGVEGLAWGLHEGVGGRVHMEEQEGEEGRRFVCMGG